MELTLLVILIVLAIIILNRFTAVKEAIAYQNSVINQLRADLRAFRSEFRPGAAPPPVPESPAEPIVEQRPVVVPVSPPLPEPKPTLEPVFMESIREPEPIRMPPPVRQPVVPPPPKPSYFQRFLAENPDLEKFIGENLINKIGIAILVAGIGYFVKFAIDQNWINEIGRVLIGVLAGGLLLGLAHRLRNTFTAFSSVLVAGGLSVLYFTIAIAFSDYHIFSQPAAFLIMVVITGFAVLLSIIYNRVELAVLSIVGGFCTPFMVSTGQSNYVVLFSYLLILDSGMLILAYFKKWNIVHWVAYGFTVLLYGTWLATEVLDAPATTPPYVGGLLFATGFYMVFMVMNLLYNLKNKLRFSAIDIILLLSNTAFYYAAGMLILENVNQGAYQGLFTAALAVVNFGIAALLYRREAVDRTLIYLLIGLVITFVSLTIPVQLSGNFITMFWALEAVLLLWLAQRSGLRLLATGAVLVMALMLVSLMMDWSTLYLLDTSAPDSILPIIFNKAFITSLIAILSLVLTYLLLRKHEEPFQFWVGQLRVPVYQRIIGYLTVMVAYMAGYNEVDYQSMAAFDYGPNSTIIQGAYQVTFALVLLFIIRRLKVHSWVIQATLFSVIVLLCYITLFDPAVHELLLLYFVGSVNSLAAFPVHYLSVAGVIGLLVLLSLIKPTLSPFFTQVWPWFLGFMVVYVASSELYAHIVYFQLPAPVQPVSTAQYTAYVTRHDALVEQITKVGLPILWGVCAFVFMYVGLTKRNRQYRILSLSLFALTLLKLFFYDLEGISEGGRIAAFISLGALLLIISFMYQRIKRLILASDAPQPEPDEV